MIELAEEPARTHSEQMMQKAAVVARTTEARIECLQIELALAHHAAEYAVRLHHREHFAGHVRGEADDALGLHVCPLAVCTGQADPCIVFVKSIERTEDLYFLPTHHIGDAAFVAAHETRGNPCSAP